MLNLAAAAEATSNFVGKEIDELKGVMSLALIGAQRNPLRRNVILWGDGGYGKSEFAYTYISAAIGEEPHVISMHKETSTAEMFGGLSIPDLQAGVLKYNVEKSWMNHQCSIWEEALDAPDAVLLAAKDSITRGKFTIGQNFSIKTRLIVINTNHDPARFRADLSKSAFLERFPIIFKVGWHNISNGERESNYAQIIRNVARNGDGNPISDRASSLLVKLATAQQWSPRRLITIVQAAQDFARLTEKTATKAVDNKHIAAISDIFGYSASDAIQEIEREERAKKIKSFVRTITSAVNEVQKKIGENYTDINVAAKLFREQTAILDDLINQAHAAREKLGQESSGPIDTLTEQIVEVKCEIQNRWISLIAQ